MANVGKGAESAVPALVEMLTKAKKEDVEAMARPQKADDTATNLSGPVLALRRIGKPAAEAVVPLLKHEEPIVRFQAAAVLSGMSPGEGAVGLPAVQAAMEAERTLPNGELYAFEEMVAATLNLGGDTDAVTAQIIELLKSEQEVVRFRAAKALARIGRKAAAAIPKLTALLNDSVGKIQMAALEALAAMGPAAKDAVPEIAKKVADDDIELAREATRTLRAFAVAAAPAVPALAKALDCERSRTSASRPPRRWRPSVRRRPGRSRPSPSTWAMPPPAATSGSPCCKRPPPLARRPRMPSRRSPSSSAIATHRCGRRPSDPRHGRDGYAADAVAALATLLGDIRRTRARTPRRSP